MLHKSQDIGTAGRDLNRGRESVGHSADDRSDFSILADQPEKIQAAPPAGMGELCSFWRLSWS